MMVGLIDSLQTVDWNQNVDDFRNHSSSINSFERGCHLIAVWAHELRVQHYDNPAVAFLMEMQASASTVPPCVSLGLYKPGAVSMRSALENSLYFSYFATHPSELHSQVSGVDYYATKTGIVDFHKKHTVGFADKQKAIGLLSELESWYSEISAIIHGQKPGTWSNRSLVNTAFDKELDDLSSEAFSRCVAIINMIFLTTTPDEIWEGFNTQSRRRFLKGFSRQKKAVIGRSLV